MIIIEQNEFSTYLGIPLEHYKLSADDIIVAKYDFNTYKYGDLPVLYTRLTRIFPYNKVVILPKDVLLEQLSRQQLIELRNSLNQTIEQLLDDSE